MVGLRVGDVVNLIVDVVGRLVMLLLFNFKVGLMIWTAFRPRNRSEGILTTCLGLEPLFVQLLNYLTGFKRLLNVFHGNSRRSRTVLGTAH